MVSSKKSQPPRPYVGAFPGRIYIGAVPKGTTKDTFENHFKSKKYGEIKSFYICGSENRVWGFGFITYANPSVADKMIREIQLINGQKVEITRTMEESNDFKNKNNKSMVDAFFKYRDREMQKMLKKNKDQAVSMDVCQAAVGTSSSSRVQLNRTIKGIPMKKTSKDVRKMKSIVEAISNMML